MVHHSPARLILCDPPNVDSEIVEVVRRAVEAGAYYEFGGGMGDIINRSIHTDIFPRLDGADETGGIVVVLVTDNPNAWQLFAFHPNAGRLLILDIPWRMVRGMENREFRTMHGLPIPCPAPRGKQHSDDFRFHPPHEDMEAIDSLPRPYVGFAMTAAAGIEDARTIPRSIVSDAASTALDEGLVPVFVGAGRHEAPPPEDGRIVSVIDRLTVPGSAEVLRQATASVVCDSAMGCAARAMRVPTFNLSYEYGAAPSHGPLSGHPNSYHCSYGAYSSALLADFLRKYKGCPCRS